MRVAVAGGTGFLGRHVVAGLLAAGHHVVALARRPDGEVAGVTRVAVDVAGDPAALAAAIAGCDALVNLVGIKRETAAQSFDRAHVEAVERLLVACAAAGVRRFVHVSVVGARAEAGPYMASKRRGELRVSSSGADWTIVRPGVIAGPGDDFLRNLAAMIRHLPLFPAPDGGGRGDSSRCTSTTSPPRSSPCSRARRRSAARSTSSAPSACRCARGCGGSRPRSACARGWRPRRGGCSRRRSACWSAPCETRR